MSKVKFMRALRIKKDDYHIANSQIIGDVFEDNDEVFCDIALPASKKARKAEKIQKKELEGKSEENKIKKKKEKRESEDESTPQQQPKKNHKKKDNKIELQS